MGMDIAGLMPEDGGHLHDNSILTLKLCDITIAGRNCNVMTHSFISMLMHSVRLRGGIKKKNCFFSEKLRKGGRGVSPNPKFPYQKKLRFFWNFFYKGGGSHLFQKGVIIKNWVFWAIFAKKGGHIDFIKKKLRIFRIFSPNGGGSGQFQNFLIRKNSAIPNCWEGGGGSQNFGVFLKKTSIFFLMPPLTESVLIWYRLNCYDFSFNSILAVLLKFLFK